MSIDTLGYGMLGEHEIFHFPDLQRKDLIKFRDYKKEQILQDCIENPWKYLQD